MLRGWRGLVDRRAALDAAVPIVARRLAPVRLRAQLFNWRCAAYAVLLDEVSAGAAPPRTADGSLEVGTQLTIVPRDTPDCCVRAAGTRIGASRCDIGASAEPSARLLLRL